MDVHEAQLEIIMDAVGELGYDTDMDALREFAEDLLDKLAEVAK